MKYRLRKAILVVWALASAPALGLGPSQTESALGGYTVYRKSAVLPGESKPVPYLLLRPSSAQKTAPGPLLVHLYGAGGSIEDYNLMRPAYDRLRATLAARGYYILVPELGPSHWMNERARRVLDAILDRVLIDEPVDRRRVHVMGVSMGGESALAYAIHRPELIRSACSIIGMTNVRQWLKETDAYRGRLTEAFGGSPETAPAEYSQVSAMDHLETFKHIPVFLIYGQQDPLVKPHHGRQLAAALAVRGFKAVYREAVGIGHEDGVVRGFETELTAFLDSSGSALPGEKMQTAATQTATTRALSVSILQTREGVRYGVLGEQPHAPAPTLFVFAGTLELALSDSYYLQCGTTLAAQGYVCVSVDLPCHGAERRADEAMGLLGWRDRAERGEPLIEDLNRRLTQVLDDLIAKGYTDPTQVAACGVSRGGFVALHFAAAEPRVRCAAVFAPVVDLAALEEFKGATEWPVVPKLSLMSEVDKLAGKAIWIEIGDVDQRVGTDVVIAFARRLSAASYAAKAKSRVELHVLPEPRGHTTPDGAFEQAARWIGRQMGPK